MGLTFLHTADWHIGNSFSRFDREMKTKLRRAIFRAIEMMFVYADKKKIPLMLVAGDVMDDGQLGTADDLLGLFKIIKKHPDITVVMITGNHDPLVARNVYSRVDRSNFPDNVHLVEDRDVLSYPEWNLTLYAASLREKNGSYNPLSWIKDRERADDVIHVGLCHGSIANEAFDGIDFPIEKNFASDSGLDYLALGDWHSYKKIDSRTYYPGVPEPLQMGDLGFVLEVTIDKPGAEPQVKKREVNQFKWVEETVDIDEDNFDEIRGRLDQGSDKEIKKFTVRGHLSAGSLKRWREIVTLTRDTHFEIDDRVTLRPDDPELLDHADGFMSAVMRRLLELKESGEALPEGMINPYTKISRKRVHDEADTLTKEEIIDRALMWAYGYSLEKE